MAEILLAWELGGESGHVTRLAEFADVFRARGHRVTFALKDLSRAEATLGGEAVCVQAPIWVPIVSGLPPAVTAAETLIRFGYLETDGLTGLVRGWCRLYDLVRPDLVFVDCAPTAMLAARVAGVAYASCNQGYSTPPARAPLPPYQWWQSPPPEPLEGAEARVLQTVNAVAERLGMRPLDALHEVFRGERDYRSMFAELDHYPDREAGHYYGSVTRIGGGEPPRWPSGNGPRIFVYLRPDYPALDALFDALKRARARVVAFLPGLDDATRERLRSSRVRLAAGPVDLALVRTQCDGVVCHSGLGTVSALLTAGRPLLLLPGHIEQTMVAMRVQTLGAGLAADPGRMRRAAAELVARLVGDAALAKAAGAFAARYARWHPRTAAEAIVADVERDFGLL